MATIFSENYSSILTALVQDQLTEDYGRELLSIHWQLLDHTREWLGKRVRDAQYPEQLAANLAYFRSELDRHAIPLEEVPGHLRTPVINGYQGLGGGTAPLGRSQRPIRTRGDQGDPHETR